MTLAGTRNAPSAGRCGAWCARTACLWTGSASRCRRAWTRCRRAPCPARSTSSCATSRWARGGWARHGTWWPLRSGTSVQRTLTCTCVGLRCSTPAGGGGQGRRQVRLHRLPGGGARRQLHGPALQGHGRRRSDERGAWCWGKRMAARCLWHGPAAVRAAWPLRAHVQEAVAAVPRALTASPRASLARAR